MKTGVRSGATLLDCCTMEMDQMKECLLPSQETMEAMIKDEPRRNESPVRAGQKDESHNK
jgi:hypothetical protein